MRKTGAPYDTSRYASTAIAYGSTEAFGWESDGVEPGLMKIFSRYHASSAKTKNQSTREKTGQYGTHLLSNL
jgi:hypothetical protein